ncbi:hypothetical protein GOP47_0012469, partial [Adiantum capillus-veneris]
YPLGIAFDIDGVLLRGGRPIEGASEALRQLYVDVSNPSQARIPHIFLTNGGGVRESLKASELSSLLGVKILPQQVFLGHTPFKSLKDRFGDSHILAVGKGEPSTVMTNYGYRSVVSMEDYVSQLKDIDPLAKYKHWSSTTHLEKVSNCSPCTKAVDAVFVVSDPVDWGRDIQVLCDVLRSGGCPGRRYGDQPPLYFAADDFEYQAAFSVERLGMGAFRIALESIFNRISKIPLAYTSFGKPEVQVFRGAEIALLKMAQVMDPQVKLADFERVYMIGDNPSTDILGAKQAGAPWFSILTRTGCFKGQDNDGRYPADLVVENVLEAVQFILKDHGLDKLQH